MHQSTANFASLLRRSLSAAVLWAMAGGAMAESGPTTVVTFWATWCANCGEVLQDMDQVQQDFSGQNVVFATAHLGEDPRADAQLAKYQVQMQKLHNGSELAARMDVTAVPWVVVLDAEGRIIDSPSATARPAQVAEQTRIALNLSI